MDQRRCERRIVTDRADLFRKQLRGFPKPVKLSKGIGGVALFPKAAVKAWVLARMEPATTDTIDVINRLES